MSSIFILCTHFLDWLAKLFHTTYTSISVVFNIYAQGLVLFCTAIWLFIKTIICILYTGFSVPAIWLIAFSIIQITIVIIAFVRYSPPLYEAFDRCVKDLQFLALQLRTSYQLINILIFIILYLACIGIDLYFIFT